MSFEEVKDAFNTAIGSIETLADGCQILRNNEGVVRAYYDPETDHTRGADQHILAKGNVLRKILC